MGCLRCLLWLWCCRAAGWLSTTGVTSELCPLVSPLSAPPSPPRTGTTGTTTPGDTLGQSLQKFAQSYHNKYLHTTLILIPLPARARGGGCQLSPLLFSSPRHRCQAYRVTHQIRLAFLFLDMFIVSELEWYHILLLDIPNQDVATVSLCPIPLIV